MLIELLQRTAGGLLRAVELLMVARAILSWFPDVDHSFLAPINGFLYTVTEPIIAPVRKVLFRFSALSSFPLDLSFLVTFFILEAIQMLIRAI